MNEFIALEWLEGLLLLYYYINYITQKVYIILLKIILLKKLWTDFDEIFCSCELWHKDQSIRYWWRYGSRSVARHFQSIYVNQMVWSEFYSPGGSTNPGGGLCCRKSSLVTWCSVVVIMLNITRAEILLESPLWQLHKTVAVFFAISVQLIHTLSGRRLVSWSPTKVAVSCFLPHRGRALSDGPTATMETDVLRLQVLDFGTAFQLICDKLTLALNNLDGY